MATDTPQDRFAQYKSTAGPSPAGAQERFAKFKSTMEGSSTDADQPKTLLHKALEGGKDFVSGVRSGLAGRYNPQAGLPGKIGQMAGSNAGAIGGGLAVGAATGGMGLLPAMGMAALGAGGGDAYQQIAQKVFGGEAPKDSGEAMKKMASRAIENVAAELGIRTITGAGKLVADMTPEMALSALKMPVESVKRAMKRPFVIPAGPEAKAAIERKAVAALEGVQDTLIEERRAVGEVVGTALDDLHKSTGGKALFDVGSVAKHVRKFMANRMQSADPTVREIVGRDLDKIERILATMEEGAAGAPGVRPTTAGLRSARAVNKIKQSIQGLTDYAKRGVPEVSSEVGQDTLRELGRELRKTIDSTAHLLGHDGLIKANASAKAVYDAYDEMRPIFATTKTDPYTLLGKVNRLSTDFNAGGLKKELMESIGKNFPRAAKHVDDLMDAIAARAFTAHAAFSPSSSLMALFRSMITPKTLGRTIKAVTSPTAQAGASAAKMLARTGTLMAAPISALQPENLKTMLAPKGDD